MNLLPARDKSKVHDVGYSLCYCKCDVGYFGTRCNIPVGRTLATLTNLYLWGQYNVARAADKIIQPTVLGGVPLNVVSELSVLRDELYADRARNLALRVAKWEQKRSQHDFDTIDAHMSAKFNMKDEAEKAMSDAVLLAKTCLKMKAGKNKIKLLKKAAADIKAASTHGGYNWGNPPPMAALLDQAILLAVEDGRVQMLLKQSPSSNKGMPVVGQKMCSSMKTNTKTSQGGMNVQQPNGDTAQTLAHVATTLADVGFTAYVNTKGAGTYSAQFFQKQVQPILSLTNGFLGQVVGLDQIKLPGIKISAHLPDSGDYDGGDDHIFVMARTKPGANILGGLVDSAAVLVAHGRWEDYEDTKNDETVVTLCASFKEPVAMMKKAFGGVDPSILFPSLRHVDMGFVVSTASHGLPNEALPDDVDMPGLFAGRDAFSSNPAFVGVYKLKENNVQCEGVDILCVFFKGIADLLGDPTIEVEIGDGSLILAISTGEVWFSNSIGLDNVEFAVEAGDDGIVVELGLTLLVCAANCDKDVASKDVLRFVGAVEIDLGPSMVVKPDLMMIGYYTFPKPLDFVNIGQLRFGASLSFATFPPLPDSINVGGAICLSRNKESGRGGCHVKNGYIEDDKYDCTNKQAPCIAGVGQFGLDKSDPEGTYIYLAFSGATVGNVLFIAGMDDLDSVPSIFREMGLKNAKLSYAPAGLAADNPVQEEPNEGLGIDIPEGLTIQGEVEFLGATGFLRAQLDSEYFEGELRLGRIDLAGILEIRRGKNSSVKDWDQGLYLKAYAGWTPNTFQGNDDWCSGAFCANGAGYVNIPLLQAQGSFMFDMSVGASCGAAAKQLVTTGSVGGGSAGNGCGVDITYEMRDLAIFGGALEADMVVRTKIDPTKPEDLHFKAYINIRTNNLFMKVVNGLFSVVRPIYDGLKKLIGGVKWMLEQAEQFIDQIFDPIDDTFRSVSRALQSTIDRFKPPFDAAMKKVRSVTNRNGNNICSPIVPDVFLQIEPQHQPAFVEMVQDYDKRHGHYPLWEPSPELWAGRPRQTLKDLTISANEAKSFLQVKQTTKFFNKVKEAGRKIVEGGLEAAHTVKAGLECGMWNVALLAASGALVPFWLPQQAMEGLRWVLANINPASIVLKLVNLAEKGIDKVFQFLMDAMNEDSKTAAALNKIAEIMEKIFSLQELSGMMEMTPQTTTLEVGVIATIFSQLVDFKLSVTLNQGDIMKAFIDEIVMKHIVPFFAPGVMELKESMEKLFGTIEEEFKKVLDAAKAGIEDVKSWVDTAKRLM